MGEELAGEKVIGEVGRRRTRWSGRARERRQGGGWELIAHLTFTRISQDKAGRSNRPGLWARLPRRHQGGAPLSRGRKVEGGPPLEISLSM